MRKLQIKLRRCLGFHEMTQMQLSELTGIRQPSISALCNNRAKEISFENIEKICNALDVPLSEWLFTEDSES